MFEKKGCIVFAYILGILFIIGLLNTGTCAGLGNLTGGHDDSKDPAVAKIAGKPLTGTQIEEILGKQQQQSNGSPIAEFYQMAGALSAALDRAAFASLAEEKKVQVTPELILNTMNREFPQFVESQKQMMIQQKKLKPGATEAEFIAEFKKLNNGSSPDDLKAARLKQLNEEFKDPEKGKELREQLLPVALIQEYENKVVATVDDLKKSYETMMFKRIAFEDVKKTKEQNEADANKALAEIKGGLKFDDAIAKFNKGRPTTPIPIGKQYMDMMPTMKPLAGLKPGEVSGVISQGNTAEIYQFIESKQNLPPDFEKNKDNNLAMFKKQKAEEARTKDLEAFKASKLEWADPAVKFSYEVYKIQQEGFKYGQDKVNEMLADLVASSKTITAKTGFGDRIFPLARYAAFESYYANLKPDKQKELYKDRIAIMQTVLEHTESLDVRMALYSTMVSDGDYEAAGDALLEASKTIVGSDASSVRYSSEIRGKTDAAEKEGKISKETILAVRKELQRWEKERIEENQAEAEQKKSSSDVNKELDNLGEKSNQPQSPTTKK